MLTLCIAVVLVGMAISDWQWGGLLLGSTRTLIKYAITIGLGVAALGGAGWARQTLASLLGLGVLYALFTLIRLGFVLPTLSVWMLAHALLNAVVAGVLFYSPAIARFQSSKNELVMP